MYLVDYHVHSINSFDGVESVESMVKSAIEAGICEICFTDHFECYQSGVPTHVFDFEKTKADILKIKEKYAPEIKILYGAELGQVHFEPEKCKAIIKRNGFDFIIASIHNIINDNDLYRIDYSMVNTDEIFAEYLGEIEKSIKIGDFDVLGHLTYPVRYMKRDGAEIDLKKHAEGISAIFKMLIDKGKGIELNMSGLRQTIGEPMPNLNILKIYKKLGGEIITIGSDAHRVRHVGRLIKEGYDILRAAGFSHICAFEKRRPAFIKI